MHLTTSCSVCVEARVEMRVEDEGLENKYVSIRGLALSG